jgi:hypothetical protein
MKLARFSIILSALVYGAIGIMFLTSPDYWASSLDIYLPTPTAVIDLQATYGGCMIAISLFFVYCLKSPLLINIGLILQAITLGGFAFGRTFGIAVNGTPKPIMFYLLSAEIVGVLLAIYCLWQIGKTDSI